MYNRTGNFASGFWIVVGGALIGLIMVFSMSWSLDDIEARADAYQRYEMALEADHSDMN